MWAVFFPLFSELAFILYLAGLKLYFEHHLLGLGRGGGDRPFVNRKTAGLSSGRDDYTVIGGAGGGGSDEGTDSGVGAGSGEGGALADEEDTAASDSADQGLEGAEKGRPADTGDEVSLCCC